ncbi:MAG: class I SAM-dependent methyltransferase [bacterium]
MNPTSKYYRRQRLDVVQLIPSSYSRVLEIGCSEGHFRDNLNQPHEYWGVEPNSDAAQQAATRLDKVFTGDYDSVEDQIPAAHFDLIVCNDVLEHVADHDAMLQSILSKLQPQGYLLLSVPNARYFPHLKELLIDKDWRYRSEGILDYTHLRFFTRKSLIRTLTDNGFKIERFEGINPCLGNTLIAKLLYPAITLLMGSDIRYLQFAVLAKPSN